MLLTLFCSQRKRPAPHGHKDNLSLRKTIDILNLSDFVPREVKNNTPLQWLIAPTPHMSVQMKSYYKESRKSESEDGLKNILVGQDDPAENNKQRIDNDIVAVTVGTILHDSAMFYVPKHLICSYSFFFKLVCSRPMTSWVQHRVEFPEEDPAIFSIFVKWLYTRTIEIPDSVNNMIEYIISIYMLADRLRATALKNSLIDLLVVIYSEEANVLDISDIALIYANTFTGSGLRRWAVDEYPRLRENIQHASWENYGKQCPEFFFDLAKASFNEQAPMPNPASDPRRYHDHDGVTHAGCCNY